MKTDSQNTLTGRQAVSTLTRSTDSPRTGEAEANAGDAKASDQTVDLDGAREVYSRLEEAVRAPAAGLIADPEDAALRAAVLAGQLRNYPTEALDAQARQLSPRLAKLLKTQT